MHAHVAPVLRGVIPILNLHLFNGIYVGLDVRDGAVIHDGDAVER